MRLSRNRTARPLLFVVFATLIAAPNVASAQDESDDAARDREVHERMANDLAQADTPKYGVGLRLRYVFFPKALIELFVGEASSGIAAPGFGLEFVRRKGDFAIHVGIEHESVSPDDGWWLEKGDNPGVPGQFPDFVDFDGLSWTTLDVQFMFLKPLDEKQQFSLRYGAGFGLGIVHGEALQTDSVCPSNVTDIQSQCSLDPNAAQRDDPADLPPVFPVVNIVFGAEYTPVENITINLEGGMRSFFYLGLGTQYYF